MLRLLHFIDHHGLVITPIIYKILVLMVVGFMGASATAGLLILYIYFKDRIRFKGCYLDIYLRGDQNSCCLKKTR